MSTSSIRRCNNFIGKMSREYSFIPLLCILEKRVNKRMYPCDDVETIRRCLIRALDRLRSNLQQISLSFLHFLICVLCIASASSLLHFLNNEMTHIHVVLTDQIGLNTTHAIPVHMCNWKMENGK